MKATSLFASLHANARQCQVQCTLSSNLDSSQSLEATPFLLPVIQLAPSVARPVRFYTFNFDSAICVNTVDFYVVSALGDSKLVRRFLVDRNCVVVLLLSGSMYLIKVISYSLLAMSQTSSQRRVKQVALFTFSRVTLLITCPRMRSISRVAPADLWLKSFILESPRSSVISRRGTDFFYLPRPLSQANITREKLNGLHHPWTGLFIQFPYGIQKLFESALLPLLICVVVSYHVPKQRCI